MQFVMRYDGTNLLVEVPETQAAITQTDWSNMIMPPGVYDYNGKRYDLSAEGLYCVFNNDFGDGGRRIIYQSDVRKLLESLSWLTMYGKADEGYTPAQILSDPWLAKTRKLAMRCGPTIELVQHVLNQVGVESRRLSVLTADTPNDLDDGHVPIEVKIGGVWTLWDIAQSRYYQDTTAHHLNLDEFIQCQNVQHVLLSDPSANNELWGGFNSNVFYDAKFRTQPQMSAWVDRIYQIPGIWHTDGKCYFYMPSGTEGRQSWVEGLSTDHVVVDYPTWKSLFY